MHVGDDEKIKFPYDISINNGQMKLNINFTPCYISVEKNMCLTSSNYYLKDLTL